MPLTSQTKHNDVQQIEVDSRPRAFLQLWKYDQATQEIELAKPLRHSASGQFGRVQIGDTVWVVTVDAQGILYVIGRIVVGEVLSDDEAVERFGEQIYEAEWHIAAQEGTEEHPQWVSLMAIASHLNFDSKGGHTHLNVTNNRVDAKQLQSMRQLTSEAARLVEEHWNSSAGESKGSEREKENRKRGEQLKGEEVISVPCATSLHITEETDVHACPNEYPWSSYRETRYMTFRASGGTMKRVCQIQDTIILPNLSEDLHMVPLEYRERVAAYIEQREREWHFTGGNFKFYILSRENVIKLPHLPRLKRNIAGHCYIWLHDLQSGEKIVPVSSQSSGVPSAVKIKSLLKVIDEVEVKEARQHENETTPPPSVPFDPEEFDPETLNDAREYQAKQIVSRRGQAGFRQRLMEAYNNQCAFTGYFPESALEAAHIVPFCGPDSNHVANGLLLRADIHTLFDQGLISVDTSDPDKLTVLLSSVLLESSYKYLNGKSVNIPKDPALRPSLKALEWHCKQADI